MLKITFQFSPVLTIEWDAEDIKKFVESVSFLDQLPRVCPVCEAPIYFQFRTPKGFPFYGIACTGSPRHECNFGQHKEGGTLFYDESKWELAYKDRESGNQSNTLSAQPGSASAPVVTPATTTGVQSASPKGDKAPIEKLNMIGAVARAKKVSDLEGLCKQMLSKSTGELTNDEADILMDYLKTL